MKVLKLGALWFFIIIVVTGCQPDEEITPIPQEEEEMLEFDPTVDNEFTYKDITQSLTDAILLGDGTPNPDGRISWQLYLTTDGLIAADGTFSGMGDFIFLELNTGNPDGLVSDTYVLNGIGTAQQRTYNRTSSLYEDFDVLRLVGTVTNIRDGEITIKVQGDQIIATFDFDLSVFNFGQDLRLKGQYQGTLTRR